MLRTWIDEQTCSKREILEKYHEALLGIELIADAEDFMKKALKKPDDADGNGHDDDDDDGSDDEVAQIPN